MTHWKPESDIQLVVFFTKGLGVASFQFLRSKFYLMTLYNLIACRGVRKLVYLGCCCIFHFCLCILSFSFPFCWSLTIGFPTASSFPYLYLISLFFLYNSLTAYVWNINFIFSAIFLPSFAVICYFGKIGDIKISYIPVSSQHVGDLDGVSFIWRSLIGLLGILQESILF